VDFLTYKRLSLLFALSDGVWRFPFHRGIGLIFMRWNGWWIYVRSLVVEPPCLFLSGSFGLYVDLADSLDIGPPIVEGLREVRILCT
jgi:hypothetical protein